MPLRLIDKPERQAACRHISSIALDLLWILNGAYLAMPTELRGEIPPNWVAWAVFVLSIAGRIGKVVRQEPHQSRAPRKPRSTS